MMPDRELELSSMPPPMTADTIDLDYESLTPLIAEQVFRAYHSPLAGKGWAKALVEIWTKEGRSAWIGLAIIQQESSYCVANPDLDIDDRNLANPFSARWKKDKAFDKDGFRKNWLLKPDPAGSYTNLEHPELSTKGYRLPTLLESVQNAADIFKTRGWAYNEHPQAYKKAINGHIENLLTKFNIKKHGKGKTKATPPEQMQQREMPPPKFQLPWIDPNPAPRWPRAWVDIIPESYLNPSED
jgi:hypothetical protein